MTYGNPCLEINIFKISLMILLLFSIFVGMCCCRNFMMISWIWWQGRYMLFRQLSFPSIFMTQTLQSPLLDTCVDIYLSLFSSLLDVSDDHAFFFLVVSSCSSHVLLDGLITNFLIIYSIHFSSASLHLSSLPLYVFGYGCFSFSEMMHR